MRCRVIPYKAGSKSARALAEALGGKCLKLENSKFVQKASDLIINWGNSTCTSPALNGNTAALREVTNKLEFFRSFGGPVIPEYWENMNDIPDDAFPVVCRTVLSGHSGAGIHISDDRASLVPAPLYVRYYKKKDEYRIHVGRRGNEIVIISEQRKARRVDFAEPNWQVRNHANGFNFVRNGIDPPACVRDAAKSLFASTGLDFGAVDVIYNDKLDKAYVLEINTAPGLEGQTVTDYAAFFQSLAA